MERAEQQLRLIQAVYRSECPVQRGEALEELRGRCEALLDVTAPKVDGDARLWALVTQILAEIGGLTAGTPPAGEASLR